MKTETHPDYLGLEVFTQMSAEESQEAGDLECAKIFGDLHSLAANAKRRKELRIDALESWLTHEEIEKTKEYLDDSVTGEILLIATILRVMSETTEGHADDLRADEAHLSAEDAEHRADDYKNAYAALLRIFG